LFFEGTRLAPSEPAQKKIEKCNHFPLCPVKQIALIASGTTHLDQYSCRIYYRGIEPVSSHLSTLHLPTEG